MTRAPGLDSNTFINGPSGWLDWLAALLGYRIRRSGELLIVILNHSISSRLAAHIRLYADGIVLGPKADFLPEWQSKDVLRCSSMEALPENLPEFLSVCRRIRERTLLWIDPNVHAKSPAMKPLVKGIDSLVDDQGWFLKIWCHGTSVGPEKATVSLLPRPKSDIAAILLIPYQVALRQILWFILKGGKPASVVHASVPGFWRADLTTVHFLNAPFCRVIWKHLRDLKTLPRLLVGLLGSVNELIYYRWGRPRLLLTVGTGVAEGLRSLAGPEAAIEVFPSCYDDGEFNPARRQKCRLPMREELGLAPDWFVSAFASQGDYRRKGFFLLAKAMDQLWESGHTHFKVLLLGGSPAGIEKLKGTLGTLCNHWETWLIVTGWVPSLSAAMSAADAFVFPSYYESFAAVEAEACALGLPLALSAHWGSEMVLRPGENGVVLPMDAEGIARALIELESKLPFLSPMEPHATKSSRFAEILGAFYQRMQIPGNF